MWCSVGGVKSVAQICGDIWGVVLIKVVVARLSDGGPTCCSAVFGEIPRQTAATAPPLHQPRRPTSSRSGTPN